MQTYEMAPAVVDSQRARSATHLRAPPQASSGFSVRRRLAKSKDKRKGKAEHRSALLTLIVFDKVGKPMNGTVRGPAVKLAGQLGKAPNDMRYNGDAKKPAQRTDLNVLNISQLYIRPKVI